MSKKLALLFNPKSSDPVHTVEIDGFEDIVKVFGESADIEGGTLARLKGNTYLQVWADCKQYMLAPAWVTTFNDKMPIHGLGLIEASDFSTGDAIDCPLSPETLLASIEWEPVSKRIDPDRPNQDWIDRFHIESVADVVVQYGDA